MRKLATLSVGAALLLAVGWGGPAGAAASTVFTRMFSNERGN